MTAPTPPVPELENYDGDDMVDACDPCPADPDPDCDRDADGDGMPDSFEIQYGLNRSDPNDAALDKDGDGLANLDEFYLGLDPTNPDANVDCPPVWTDGQIQSGTTLIKAAHFKESIGIIGYLRSTNGLAPYPWKNPALTPGSSVIYAADIRDLRMALADVLITLGKTVPNWETDLNLIKGNVISGSHTEELRQGVQDACN